MFGHLYIQHSSFIIQHLLSACQHQCPEHQRAVDDQQFVAKLVAEEPLLGMRGQNVAERRDSKGDDRNQPAALLRDFALGEHTEGEQAQNRAVCVGRHHEDDADERVVVVVRHDDDDHQEERGDDQVDEPLL